MNPTWLSPTRRDATHRKRVEVEEFDGRRIRFPVRGVAETANDDNAVADRRGGVEIGRRKNVSRIAVDVDAAGGMADNDIIVDVEIRIVRILMLAGDEYGAPVAKPRRALSKSRERPRGLRALLV